VTALVRNLVELLCSVHARSVVCLL